MMVVFCNILNKLSHFITRPIFLDVCGYDTDKLLHIAMLTSLKSFRQTVMTKKITSFKAPLLFQNYTIAHYYSLIEQQKKHLALIHDVLPSAIADHALHCVVHGKKLVIYTDTAAWASQLRFYNNAILAAVAPVIREPVSIMQIKILIDALATNPLPNRKPIIPSAEKIAFIHNHSLTVEDEQLKLSLLRLAATLAKLSASN
jgi:hypothetical protein